MSETYTIDPDMPYLDHKVSALRHELGGRWQVPCLGVVPWHDDPRPECVAAHLDDVAWQSAFELPECVAPVAALNS